MISLKIPTGSLACYSPKHRNYLIQQTHVLYQATDILGSYKSALRWFVSPARGLDGTSPCHALNQKSGYLRVQHLLIKIDYGIYI
ncbi:antitoxin Xre/MbcA/ParS toxin-binding domain-containing protein [Pseudomonas oryzihabitans]|uniref:antitoxin Xre/MbcA/ParS toxin-binding domain-containing protein n=1 Tax=Pseudomonas oryzihabitans TaxID=47885 RepID=UPI0011A6180B